MLTNWKKYLFFLFIVIVIVAVVLYYHYRHKPMAMKPFAPPPATVVISKVQPQQWPTILQGTGTITAQQGLTIRAQVSGQILAQYVHSSSLVKEGESLYQIDPQGLGQLIKQNKAQLALAKSELDEQAALVKKRFVSKDDYDKAVSSYQVALNTLKQNERKLALTKVRAPFAGKLGVMLVHKGDFVNVNDPLVSLQDPNSLRVDFTLPGNFANRARMGQLVHLETLEYPNQAFQGKVISVNASVNQASQSILVRAHLEAAAEKITPGSFASVQLYLDQKKPVLAIPQTALIYSDSGIDVYKVVKGVAHLIAVKVGQRNGNMVAIESGLNANESVVSEGKVKLMDGARVVQAKTPN
jgi:membrane fusion protein (multidrug efflux system)